MARTRQHSYNGSPPDQGRAGSVKLRVSRREGFLLSLIVVLGIAICAIAFYKTGDPGLPLAPGKLRRPGDPRADDLPSSLSSHSRFRVFPAATLANFAVSGWTQL